MVIYENYIVGAEGINPKKVLSKEILDRFKSRSTAVQLFLVEEDFLTFLDDNQVEDLFEYIVDKRVMYYLVSYYLRLRDTMSSIKVLNRFYFIFIIFFFFFKSFPKIVT